jgi:DNA-binding transcriptional regulator YhcF (GntR family)
MDFYVDKHSSISPVSQIEEQIKLAIAMGTFRSGDTLPSIRDVERQTGVNRGQIHRAYIALRHSGLLTLARGKGTVIAAATSSNDTANKKCLRLSESIISKVRKFGVSPTAFGRYLSQQTQVAERSTPYIAYFDRRKEVAEQRASEVSRIWQVPVIGLTVSELKKAVRKNPNLRKVLCNHLSSKYARTLIPDKNIDLIPIEVSYTEQTIRDLARIRPNSSILRILAPAYLNHAPFIIAQLQKWVKSPGVEISSISVDAVSSFAKLLNGSRYDCVILDPGILSHVPSRLQRSRRILLVRLQLDSSSLEAARLRAGVII